MQLRGRRLLSGFTPDGFAEAAQLFERSIELDPAYVSAYPGLALTHFISFTNGWNGATEKSLEIGIQNAEKAVEIDPTEPEAYWALALGRFWQHNIEDALSAIDKGVALGPNHAEIHATQGYILSHSSRPEEAIESVEKAMQLDPQYPALWLHFMGHAHFVHGDYEQAATVLERRIRREPETYISRGLLVSCYGHLGLVTEATEEWTRLLEINPDYSIERKAQVQPYKNRADWDRVIDGFRKAGLHE